MSICLKSLFASALIPLLLSYPAAAQVAGIAVAVSDRQPIVAVASGYSVQRSILRRPVYNETDHQIGTIDDLIIDPGGNVTFVIIGAGRFVGSARHDVAVQVGHLANDNGRFVLSGATEQAILRLPKFEYVE